MSQTTNYGFSKPEATTKLTVLVNYNGNLDLIDSTIKGVSDAATTASSTATAAQSTATAAQTAADAAQSTATAAGTAAAAAASAATAAQSTADSKAAIDDTAAAATTTYSSNKIETELATKQATITGAATSILDSNLTTNRALISNSTGKVEASSITSTQLGYLSGVTSNIQSQINALKTDTLIKTRQRVPNSMTTYTLTSDIDNFTNLYFELTNSNNETVDSALVPVSMFKNGNGIYLKTMGYEQPVGVDMIYVKYVTDTSFSMKNNTGWETYLTIYGHM